MALRMMLTSSIAIEGNTRAANKSFPLEEMSGKRKCLMDMECFNTRFSGFQASAYYAMCKIQREKKK